MKYSKRKTRIKKLPYGGVLSGATSGATMGSMLPIPAPGVGIGAGALVGAVAGGLASDSAKRAEEEARKNRLKMWYSNKNSQDAQELIDYDENGQIVDFFALGGELDLEENPADTFETAGGDLNPIGTNAAEVDGNTHESNAIDGEYGVKLVDPNTGQAVAEVEDDEVLINDYVYSDRLKDDKGVTFAKRAKSIAKKREKLEEELSGQTYQRKRNGIERTLDGLDLKEQNLKNDQELEKLKRAPKQTAPVPEFEEGGKLDKFLPFVDNVVNMGLTLDSPEVAVPLNPAFSGIETSVNVSPQISAVREGVGTASDFIKRNTSSSNIARANIASTKLEGAKQLTAIEGNKANMETSLRNQAAQGRNQQSAIAAANANQYADKQFARRGAIQSRISTNVSDLVEDFKGARANELADKDADDKLLIALLNDPTRSKEDKVGEARRLLARMPNIARTKKMKEFLSLKE